MGGGALPPLSITFLGTSAASLSPRATTTSLLLTCGDHRVLLDCGIGSLRQLRRAGHDPQALEGVVLTHWHHDHTSGLPRLLRAAAPRGGSGPSLPVHGPRAPRGVLRALQLSLPRRLTLNVHAVVTGFTMSLGKASLRAIRTEHSIASLGWELVEAGPPPRRLVISGDTQPTAGIAAAATGADLLVHEATFLTEHASWARRDGHTTATDAAALAHGAGVGALALTHVPGRYTRAAVLAEGRSVFPAALLPDDLDTLTVFAVAENERATATGWARLTHARHRSAP
ncbi:MAG TPA: MBL fold metallo-hydrolase [Candidatus Dormibacteraeota bacterium]